MSTTPNKRRLRSSAPTPTTGEAENPILDSDEAKALEASTGSATKPNSSRRILTGGSSPKSSGHLGTGGHPDPAVVKRVQLTSSHMPRPEKSTEAEPKSCQGQEDKPHGMERLMTAEAAIETKDSKGVTHPKEVEQSGTSPSQEEDQTQVQRSRLRNLPTMKAGSSKQRLQEEEVLTTRWTENEEDRFEPLVVMTHTGLTDDQISWNNQDVMEDLRTWLEAKILKKTNEGKTLNLITKWKFALAIVEQYGDKKAFSKKTRK
jgi:hypothetical protein